MDIRADGRDGVFVMASISHFVHRLMMVMLMVLPQWVEGLSSKVPRMTAR